MYIFVGFVLSCFQKVLMKIRSVVLNEYSVTGCRKIWCEFSNVSGSRSSDDVEKVRVWL